MRCRNPWQKWRSIAPLSSRCFPMMPQCTACRRSLWSTASRVSREQHSRHFRFLWLLVLCHDDNPLVCVCGDCRHDSRGLLNRLSDHLQRPGGRVHCSRKDICGCSCVRATGWFAEAPSHVDGGRRGEGQIGGGQTFGKQWRGERSTCNHITPRGCHLPTIQSCAVTLHS